VESLSTNKGTGEERIMKRTTHAVAMIGLAAGLLLSIFHVQESHAAGNCSETTLNGSYGFYRTGVTSTGLLVAVGVITFDGDGHHDGTQTFTRDGGTSFSYDATDPNGPGTYEVASNCTGKLRDGLGAEIARLVVTDGGDGVYMLKVNQPPVGAAVYVVARKIR
jgi:hypothetical protein